MPGCVREYLCGPPDKPSGSSRSRQPQQPTDRARSSVLFWSCQQKLIARASLPFRVPPFIWLWLHGWSISCCLTTRLCHRCPNTAIVCPSLKKNARQAGQVRQVRPIAFWQTPRSVAKRIGHSPLISIISIGYPHTYSDHLAPISEPCPPHPAPVGPRTEAIESLQWQHSL